MGKKPEEEIEAKLRELELAMKEPSNTPAVSSSKSTDLSGGTSQSGSAQHSSKAGSESLSGDLHLLGGLTALALGLFILFSHVQVSMGWNLFMWGGNGGGYLVLLLLVGLGFFFYDYKNKIGWLLIAGSIAAIIVNLFASMHLILPSMSLLGLITIMLPLVIGGALIARGLKMQSGSGDQNSGK